MDILKQKLSVVCSWFGGQGKLLETCNVLEELAERGERGGSACFGNGSKRVLGWTLRLPAKDAEHSK